MQFFTRFFPGRDLLSVHNIRWLVASRFLADLFFYSTTIVLFQSQRGLDFTGMFLMESIISAAIWLWEIPTGIWADQFGYRRLIISGRILGVVGMVVFVLAHGFWLFAFSNLLAGIGIACVSGCESAMVYGSLPEGAKGTRGTSAFALLNAASSLGFFLGLSTGSFIGAYSPTLAVAVSIVPMILAVLASLRLHKGADPAAINALRKERVRAPDLLRAALRSMREQPALVGLGCFDYAAFVLANSIFWYNQPYFLRAGIPIAWFGPITGAAMGLQVVVTLLTGSAQRRLGKRLALIVSCLLPGTAYAVLAMTRAPVLTMLLVGVVIACVAWRRPVVNAELNRRISDGSRATMLSALSSIGSLIGIALNPLIGHAGDLGLSVVGASIGLGLIALCLPVPFLVQGEHRPRG